MYHLKRPMGKGDVLGHFKETFSSGATTNEKMWGRLTLAAVL